MEASAPGRAVVNFMRSKRLAERMRVHVTLHGFEEREREVDLPEGALADDVPRALGLRPELVLVFRGNRPLPGDAPVADGDRVRVLRVVSGGARAFRWWSDPKRVLLAISLAWLAAFGAAVARTGALDAPWMLAYAALVVGFALLGLVGFARRPLRYAAAAVSGALVIAVAWITFTHLLVLAGTIGVTASILLPPRSEERGG